MKEQDVIVVGAGAFGVAAALELSARGARVSVVDPGPLPHPDAASTDISKAVRMDYGSDELYVELACFAIERWHEWNASWPEPLFHEDGFLVMRRTAMARGNFEGDSYRVLTGLGIPLERLDCEALSRRFPAWESTDYVDGYLNPRGGWAESGAVIAALLRRAEQAGVTLHEGERFARLIQDGSRVCGITTVGGRSLSGDCVVLAAGAWTPTLLPSLRNLLQATGQPVLHFKPEDPAPYRAERFPVWAADIANHGWYGFPATTDGIVKVGRHGPGKPVHPNAPRELDPSEEQRFREFLRSIFPRLAAAPLAGCRLCLYCDSWDGDFWIDHHPERDGLVVAAGGSGHGFKFVPVLGQIIADVVERRSNRFADRFAWRARGSSRKEQARQTRAAE